MFVQLSTLTITPTTSTSTPTPTPTSLIHTFQSLQSQRAQTYSEFSTIFKQFVTDKDIDGSDVKFKEECGRITKMYVKQYQHA